MIRSLRRYLMLGIATATTTIFVVAALAIYGLARESLVAEFDAATLAKARAVASMVEVHKGKVSVEELEESQLPEYQRTRRPDYFQVWTLDRGFVAKSKTLGGAELPWPMMDFTGDHVVSVLKLPDGRDGRAVGLPFTIHIEEDEHYDGRPPRCMLALARDTGEMDRLLTQLAWLLLGVCAAAVAATLGLTALVIRRGLRPVDHLAERIEGMGARNLSGRLSVETAPSELSPIVLGLNGLLDRLESAFEREKSFTADAAHELRTPLAGLQSALEVCSRKVRAPEDYAAVVGECLDVVRGMHAMIDNLLLLARADANQIPAACSVVNLDELLEDTWRRFQKAAEQRGLQIGWEVSPGLCVETDREKLSHVLSNLFDNAVRYADEGGQIGICAAAEGDSAMLRISNTGSRVSSEDAARVFERFWRGDPARTDIGTHCGLGLSVCRNMMNMLRGSIRASSTEGGEFVVEISLPVSKLHPDFMVPA